jgi:hypothetical protein
MRIEEARNMQLHIENDPEGVKFQEGRIEVLSDIKKFLIKNLNPKLPRSIRKQ